MTIDFLNGMTFDELGMIVAFGTIIFALVYGVLFLKDK